MATWKKIAYSDQKLDDFGTPDDNTDLDATNAHHGLLPKLIDDTTKFLRSDGTWQVPAGGGGGLETNIITSTRVLTAASGDVAYTGAGFQPTAVIALVVVPSSSKQCASVGVGDDDADGACIYWYDDDSVGGGAYLVGISASTADPGTLGQTAIIKSFDADGFTLTWAKNGAPSGTANLYFLCMK